MPKHARQTPISPSRRSLTLDVERYQCMLDAPDKTDDRKEEVIKALWNIVIWFMELDYQVLPLQTCGKELSHAETGATNRQGVVSSYKSAKPKFTAASTAIDKEAS